MASNTPTVREIIDRCNDQGEQNCVAWLQSIHPDADGRPSDSAFVKKVDRLLNDDLQIRKNSKKSNYEDQYKTFLDQIFEFPKKRQTYTKRSVPMPHPGHAEAVVKLEEELRKAHLVVSKLEEELEKALAGKDACEDRLKDKAGVIKRLRVSERYYEDKAGRLTDNRDKEITVPQ